MPESNSDSSAISPPLVSAPRWPWGRTDWWGLRRLMEQAQFHLIVIALVLVATVVWACRAEVDRVVRVEGKIIPAGRAQNIQHLEGGILAAIDTQEGAVVKKGDVLLVIDNTTAEAGLSETQVKLAGQQLRAARLEAESKGLDSMTIPGNLDGFKSMEETERQLFRVRRQKLEQEQQIFIEQIHQRTSELQEVEGRRALLAGELETARKRMELYTNMAAKNAASSLEVLEAKSREQRLLTELNDAEGSRPKLKSAIAEAEARVAEAATHLRADAQAELSATLMEIDRLQQIMTTQNDRYSRTEIRAPADGIVNRVNVTTVGGVVKPGDTLIELVPTTDGVLLEAKARPADRGELRTGLPAKVKVSAYDVGELGSLTGHVVEVSADTVPDPKGEPFYRVVIRVDALPEAYAGKQILPGMTITGDVVIGRRTIAKYITSPYTKFTYNAFRDAR